MALIGRSSESSFGSSRHFYNNNTSYNNSLGYNLYNTNTINIMEKRQVFLRSYQFSRKKSLRERIKRSLVRVKRVIWVRLKSAKRFRSNKLSCFRLAFSYRRRRFVRLINTNNYNNNNNYCFW